MINKYGSHWSLIVGSGLGLLSGFTKTFVHPDRFYLIVIGKIISAIQQVNLFTCYSLLFIILLQPLCRAFFDDNYALS